MGQLFSVDQSPSSSSSPPYLIDDGRATPADRERSLASDAAIERGNLMRQSQEAWNRGDRALAKTLSDRGKAIGLTVASHNDKASKLHFASHNDRHADDCSQIDLHGLYVTEAIEQLRLRIAVCIKHQAPHLVVIHGRGNHSNGGISKLKIEVLKYCQQQRLNYHADTDVNTPNEGCTTIYFVASSAWTMVPRAGPSDAPTGCNIM